MLAKVTHKELLLLRVSKKERDDDEKRGFISSVDENLRRRVNLAVYNFPCASGRLGSFVEGNKIGNAGTKEIQKSDGKLISGLQNLK